MNSSDEIKQLRIGIDRIAQLVYQLNPIKAVPPVFKDLSPSRSVEIVDCYKSLLLAKAWSGKMLGELGNETPYKNDGNRHEVKDIEPADDKAIVPTVDESTVYGQKNNIEKVDYLRQEIQKCVLVLVNIPPVNKVTKNNVYTHLCEARFHLGFELERKRNESI